MEQQHLRYLELLNTALARQVLPAVSTDMAGHMATLCTRLINRILITENEQPDLFRSAVADWLKLDQALHSVLPESAYLPLKTALQTGKEHDIQLALAAAMRLFAQAATPQAADLGGALLGVDIRMREAIESTYSRADSALRDSEISTVVEGLTESELKALVACIAERIPQEDALRIAWQKQVPGGFSKQTVILGLENNKVLPDQVVIRRDGVYLPSGNSVSFEFPVISTLFEAGVAVPQPFLLAADDLALQRPFMLVGRVDGKNFGDTLEVSQGSKALGLDLARQMAILHNVDATQFSANLPGATISTRQRVGQEIAADLEKWDSLSTPSFIVSGAFEWLLRHLDRADGARSLVHRDIGPHNMLVLNDRVMALLDWETPVIGNPAEDVGYSADIIRQMMALDEFLEAYNAVARQPIDLRQMAFYDLWASVRLTVLIGGARQGVLAGQLHDVKLAYVSEHYTARLMPRIARKLQALLAG